MNITPRLEMIASLVKDKSRLADIGTDHGFLPIYLFERGKISYAVCSDIKEGPLSNAEKNLKKYGYFKSARLCLADGLSGVCDNEVDTVVIAGMGGEMIASILEEKIPEGVSEFIFQPMRNIDVLRKKIHKLGLKITDEKIVREKEKFYIIICAEKGCQTDWEEEEYIVSRFMKKEPLWTEFSQKERHKIIKAKEQLKKSEDTEKKDYFDKLLKLYN